MDFNIDLESVSRHIRETLCVPDDHTIMIGGLTTTGPWPRTAIIGEYKVTAHIKVIKPSFKGGPYTSIPWVKVEYLTTFLEK